MNGVLSKNGPWCTVAIVACSVLTLFACSTMPIHTLAATEDFTVRQLVGGDTTPPTIPQNLTVTPVATSQINLSWDPSTDNYLLSGYQIFRDDVQIATTSATNYSDTGLIASTTYTYFVTAFDSFFNISASSTPAATTTLSSTTPPLQTTPSKQGTKITLELIRLEIIPAHDSVILRYETKTHTRATIRWGTTISYELGSLAEQAFSKTHETIITGLRPGTMYRFVIDGEHALGVRGTLTEGTFTTLPPQDTFPPGNVQNLRAVRDGDDIVLTWDNPTDSDLSRIRVLQNERFFPSDTADGWVIYEGVGTSARDTGAAIPGTRRFYTVFTYDELGNISSGAVVSVYVDDGVEEGYELPPIPIETEENPIALRFSDIIFFQDGEQLPTAGDRAIVDGAKRLVVALPYERVPEHLKTILVTLTNNEGKEFAFLLRINTDKTAYVAELAPFGVSELYPTRITIFDYMTAQIGTARGTIVSEIIHTFEKNESQSFFAYVRDFFSRNAGYVILFLLTLIVLPVLSRRLLRGKESN